MTAERRYLRPAKLNSPLDATATRIDVDLDRRFMDVLVIGPARGPAEMQEWVMVARDGSILRGFAGTTARRWPKHTRVLQMGVVVVEGLSVTPTGAES